MKTGGLKFDTEVAYLRHPRDPLHGLDRGVRLTGDLTCVHVLGAYRLENSVLCEVHNGVQNVNILPQTWASQAKSNETDPQ